MQGGSRAKNVQLSEVLNYPDLLRGSHIVWPVEQVHCTLPVQLLCFTGKGMKRFHPVARPAFRKEKKQKNKHNVMCWSILRYHLKPKFKEIRAVTALTKLIQQRSLSCASCAVIGDCRWQTSSQFGVGAYQMILKRLRGPAFGVRWGLGHEILNFVFTFHCAPLMEFLCHFLPCMLWSVGVCGSDRVALTGSMWLMLLAWTCYLLPACHVNIDVKLPDGYGRWQIDRE